MATKDHKNLLRRELGYQLGLWRIQQRQTLHQVAAANHIRPYVLDQIEMGVNVTWKHYHKILKYYNCEIQLVEKTTNQSTIKNVFTKTWRMRLIRRTFFSVVYKK